MADQQVQNLLSDAREVYGVFGKNQQALKIVDRALSLEPHNVEALNLKAAILYDLDRDDEAKQLHLAALESDPNSVEALQGLSALANDAGNYADAVTWADRGFEAIPNDTYTEFIENDDYRQRLIAELYNEKAFALWYLDRKAEAEELLTKTAPEACPLEVESFEDQLDWLQEHPDNPEE